MSGVSRFLSRRDKKHTHHRDTSHPTQHSPTKSSSRPDHFGGIFTLDDATHTKVDKEEEKKVKAIIARLHTYGVEQIVESNVEYALRAPASKGDPEEAFTLLMLLEDTYEGIVRPYSAEAKLLGAENRQNVTCFLDALLFAMFARLDSFEAMLYEGFTDTPRRKLAGMLRLWVNMLRAGKLITTDLTKHLQEALAECGWEDARELRQQDPSEAFGFITGQLELPLLTLKMDLYHTGKEDPADDHKFVNERLLEVAIPDEPTEGASVITLEDCLEHYFNNRIEVKRHMEAQRRNTLQGNKADDGNTPSQDDKKDSGLHVEVAEVPETPMASTPIAETPVQSKNPLEKLRPTAGRKRADSIFSQRKVALTGVDPEKPDPDDNNAAQDGSGRGRRLSTRTEVLMPAWQFFKLLPWYTDHLPTSDAQVAAHFSRKRPVLGICLKRYFYTSTGEAKRRDTYVDIPLEIRVPNFVSDDSMQDDGPLEGNFRLVLQSVVCHRGNSVHSGHYICLSRGQATNAQSRQAYEQRDSDSDSDDEPQDPWMRFDDLSKERVSYVDIREALREETPYMLFYQVQPVGDDGRSIHDLPSYAEATSRTQSDAAPMEKTTSDSDIALTDTLSEPRNSTSERTTEATDFGASPSTRNSIDVGTVLASDPFRGRSSASFTRDNRRPSIAFLNDGNVAGSVSGGSIRTDGTTNSTPATPSEEKSNAFLSITKNMGSRRTSRVSTKDTTAKSRSRPTSTGPGDKETSRFSLNMSKLTSRMSRADMSAANNLTALNTSANALPNIQPSEAVAAELTNEKDAMSPVKQPGVVAITALPPVEDAHTRNSATMPPKPAPGVLSKKEKAAAKKEKRHSHHGGKGQEERDCVLM